MGVELLMERMAGETEILGEKPATEQLCPPEIPHDLTGARTGAANSLYYGTAL
jgi:hypothetical protein